LNTCLKSVKVRRSSKMNNVPTFTNVKDILNGIISNWTKGNKGVAPLLKEQHSSNDFGWDTVEALKGAHAKGYPLIQPEVIGVAGAGQTANIVIDLTTGGLKRLDNPNRSYPAMPSGGLDSNTKVFLTLESPEIKTIISWIEAGCPD
jgi:hypothetical protein